MFPMMPAQGNKEERELIKLYKSLNEADRNTVFAFTEFLYSKSNKDTTALSEQPEEAISKTPLNTPRPKEESVIKAIKRLTKNYPMVDKETILNPISGLMTSHIMQGRDAVEVIDELETLFLKEYESLAEKQ